MSAKKVPVVSAIARESVIQLNPEQRTDVLRWANQALVIVNDKGLSKAVKIQRLRKVKAPRGKTAVFVALLNVAKKFAWDGQSWTRRFALVGFVAGAAAFGSQGAGIAALGGAVGVPLALLSTVGATFLGALVDEIQKEKLTEPKMRSRTKAVSAKTKRRKQLR